MCVNNSSTRKRRGKNKRCFVTNYIDNSSSPITLSHSNSCKDKK